MSQSLADNVGNLKPRIFEDPKMEVCDEEWDKLIRSVLSSPTIWKRPNTILRQGATNTGFIFPNSNRARGSLIQRLIVLKSKEKVENRDGKWRWGK